MNRLELRDIGLTFNDEGGKHIHLLNDNEVPGCTSVSGLFQDDGWKFAWPVKLMEQETLKELEIVAPGMEEIYKKDVKEILKNTKNSWRKKRDKSAGQGVHAHKWIENWIGSTHDFVGTPVPIIQSTLDEFEKNCVLQFLEWENKTKPQWLGSEVQVGSEIYQFAGILDGAAIIDGKKTVVDFKTSSSIKDEYWIQLTGLCIALTEQGWRPEVMAILHLPKEGEYEYVEKPNEDKFIHQFLTGLEFLKQKNLYKGMMK